MSAEAIKWKRKYVGRIYPTTISINWESEHEARSASEKILRVKTEIKNSVFEVFLSDVFTSDIATEKI